jgi:hypothetical protein
MDDDLRSRAAAVTALTDAFCAEHLDAGYDGLCRRLVARLAARTPSPLRAGHPETWAAGVVLAGVRFVQERTIRLMADQEDVRRIALALPETDESDEGFAFSVRNKGKDKGFVWSWKERVQPKQPRVAREDVIAVRVVDQRDKAALLASDEDVYFTEPHYNGFPAVLVRLPNIELAELEELIVDAWRSQAPPALVKEWSMRSAT